MKVKHCKVRVISHEHIDGAFVDVRWKSRDFLLGIKRTAEYVQKIPVLTTPQYRDVIFEFIFKEKLREKLIFFFN